MGLELIRRAWLVIVTIFGALVVAYFRSMGFGLSARMLLADLFYGLIWVLPLAVPALMGTRLPQALRRAGYVLFASVLLGEGWCLAEEWVIARDLGPCDAAATAQVRERWWPFDAHYVYCTPGRGWGAGD